MPLLSSRLTVVLFTTVVLVMAASWVAGQDCPRQEDRVTAFAEGTCGANLSPAAILDAKNKADCGFCSPGEPEFTDAEETCTPPGNVTLVDFRASDWTFFAQALPMGVTVTDELRDATVITDELAAFLNKIRQERDGDSTRFLSDPSFVHGQAANNVGSFGSGGVECIIQTNVQDPGSWPVTTQLLIRRVVNVNFSDPSLKPSIKIVWAMDNDLIDLFFNPDPEPTRARPILQNFPHGLCSVPLDPDIAHSITVSNENVRSGENLVSFHLVDRGVESFFDARIELVPHQDDPGIARLTANARVPCVLP